jgi:hypothetical protein
MKLSNSLQYKLIAFAGVLIFFSLVWLYTREFPVFTNTIGARRLVLVSMLAGGLVGSGIVYALRQRFTPWDRHLPEVATILVFSIVFAPLFASLFNRAGGTLVQDSFEFVSENPFLSSNYGILKGEKIKPSGYRLIVKEKGRQLLFQYKKQQYFPLTRPGEAVLLPLRKGLLGFRVLELE